VPVCFFTSDPHGRPERYEKLWRAAAREKPAAIFLGGDLLPHAYARRTGPAGDGDFVQDFLAGGFRRLRGRLGRRSPRVFLVLGNDDGRLDEPVFRDLEGEGLWEYVHGRKVAFGDHPVFGYACVPPTPFRLKDWERYDVSRYVPPGALSPEEGTRTVPVADNEIRYATIAEDLEKLAAGEGMERALFLFHGPPHETKLDRAALDGKSVDHVPLDLHVGSIAVRRFLEKRQPLLSLHGHVHESARITGSWRDRIGRTHLFGGCHDGPELALVTFDLDDLDDLDAATRRLL